jgi:hypothetical protein
LNLKKKQHLLIPIMGFFLVVSILSGNNSYSDTPMINETTTDENHDLTSLKMSWYNNSEDPIYIDGSATGVGAHNWTWARDTQEWCRKGDGSWEDPYIIENVTIDATGSATGCGIYINNSRNIYFEIRNCTIFNAGSGNYDANIKLENTSNGTITKNTLSSSDSCDIMLLNSCSFNTISENNGTGFKNYGLRIQDNCAFNFIHV